MEPRVIGGEYIKVNFKKLEISFEEVKRLSLRLNNRRHELIDPLFLLRV